MAVSTMIVIPARMASTRLPGKPLADIAGKPMIVRVAEAAKASGVGPTVVATDDGAILKAVRQAGFDAVMTRPDHVSGSDRVHEAAERRIAHSEGFGAVDRIINLQGDFPAIDPAIIAETAALLDDEAVDIGTAAATIKDPRERFDPNVVKVVGTHQTPKRMRALYFSRAPVPYSSGPLFHHVGIYAWRRAALNRFISLQPSPLEKRERLEQLRALEDNMRIDVACVDSVPLGVDTPALLARVRGTFGDPAR